MSQEEDERPIETGGFRVDRRRALHTLRAHQLPPSVSRLSLWFRCAVLSGASYFRLDGGHTWSEYSFDGEPFSEDELKEPCQGLFAEEGAASPRGRFLALAWLNAFPRHVRSVELVSGGATGRRRLSAERPGEERVSPADDGLGERTVVRISWPVFFPYAPAGHPILERRRSDGRNGNRPHPLEQSPIPVHVEGDCRTVGSVIPAEGQGGGASRTLSVAGARVHLRRAWGEFWNVPLFGPRFFIGQHGVRIGPLSGIRAPRLMTGWIDTPDIGLNASLSGVVEDERLERARALLQDEIDRFDKQAPSAP